MYTVPQLGQAALPTGVSAGQMVSRTTAAAEVVSPVFDPNDGDSLATQKVQPMLPEPLTSGKSASGVDRQRPHLPQRQERRPVQDQYVGF